MNRELASWRFSTYTVNAAEISGKVKIFFVPPYGPGLVISYEGEWLVKTLTPKPPPPQVKVIQRRIRAG